MRTLLNRLLAWRRHRCARIVLTLLALSAVCDAMLLARMIHLGNDQFHFLAGNLILAWVPLGFAFAAEAEPCRRRASRWRFAAWLLCWQLFLPNAPYMVTDLIHLARKAGPLGWYDAVMLFGYALVALQTGLLSLFLVHRILGRLLGRAGCWIAVGASIGLSGFGMYVGRVLRFHTVDLVREPVALAGRLTDQLDADAALRTVMYALIFGVGYALFRSLVALGRVEQGFDTSRCDPL